ncbi:hypothetical protein OCU04_001016 [Sclerotinia nivalis]|uniref:LysM domain-containing protein n=1 Tax=Sclerotinia nivalis TaxID=352851 RepID=A0A9X0AXS4_9HELO|nr:hypothetical protein OCU04_001016 [Sclerotinia nivalis]
MLSTIYFLALLCFEFASSTYFEDYSGLLYGPAGGWQRSQYHKRQINLLECHLNYTTDVWTGCANVLSQFNITLAYFESSNPEVGPNCGSFVPGNTYCIFRAPTTGTLIQPSTNGLCGMQQNWTNTCVGSQWGNCCGSGGGKTSENNDFAAVDQAKIIARKAIVKKAVATVGKYIPQMAFAVRITIACHVRQNSGLVAHNMDPVATGQIFAALAAKADNAKTQAQQHLVPYKLARQVQEVPVRMGLVDSIFNKRVRVRSLGIVVLLLGIVGMICIIARIF